MSSVTDTYPLQWQLGLAVLITTQPIKDSNGNVIPPSSVLAYINELSVNLAASQQAFALVQQQNQTFTSSIAQLKMCLNAAMPAVTAAMNNAYRFKTPDVTPCLPDDLLDHTLPNHLHNGKVLDKLNWVLANL